MGTPRGAWLVLIAVVLVGINLRPGASAVGTVLEELRTGLAMSGAMAGVLTGLPGLCFGLIGLTAVAVSRRTGLAGGIALGLVAVAVGLGVRSLTGSLPVFLAMSVLALAGMAIGNVLAPAWIKHRGEDAQVRLMTAYGACLVVGGAIGPLVTGLIAAPHGWRPGLAVWSLVALLAVPLWVGYAMRDRGRLDATEPAPSTVPIWRAPTAVAMAGALSIQATQAYVQFGWLPQIYRDAGVSARQAGILLASLQAVTLLGALAMPTVVARSRTLAPHFTAFGVLMAAGYLGLLFAPAQAPWLWVILLGLSGCAFPTVIALLSARARTPSATARLSGFVQPVAYLVAGIGPLLVGLLHEATGGWTAVLLLLASTGVPLVWLGLKIARPAYVDDEL